MAKQIASVMQLVVILVLLSNVVMAESIDGCKEYSGLGLPGQQGELLCRKGHLLAHSKEHKTPIWVIERLSADKAKGNIPRSNKFEPDPDLDEGERAELEDYKGSGYDRGHMAPSADMRWDKQAMEECFFLSNMVPQVGAGMNQGIWKNLEKYAREMAISRGEVYIMTGPIYADGLKKTIGPNKVGVATHFYKIIYDPYKTEALAFIMPNQKIDGSVLQEYLVTVRDVEKKTGLDFLSNMDKDVQDIIENKKQAVLWH